jgi:hypothetical protein
LSARSPTLYWRTDSALGGTPLETNPGIPRIDCVCGHEARRADGAEAATPLARPLSGPVEHLLSGGARPSDPLYLSNRTLTQKLKSWSLIAIPCLLILGVAFTVNRSLNPPAPKADKPLTAAEITAKMLPNLDTDIKHQPSSDVQVLEVRVEGSRLVGVVKNTTAREIAATELVIDLTDAAGSQLGAVNGIVEKIPGSGTKNFQIAIRQRGAAFALIRTVKSS